MAREFDITDIAGLRRSPSVAGFRARQGSQNAVPFRPGAAPQRPSILSEMTPPAAPATPARSRNEQAWMAAQLNPNMGVLPPELSTGSRLLDDELLRRARRQAGVANGQAAIQELKRQQWLTGQRTVADEMPGATAPEYAGAWQETQVGPSDNGVWTAPDGTRYAMRNGVPVGRSGAATGGTWEMGAGQVGEFTGWGDTASRQNYLRDELLGKMGQTMEPPARGNVTPMDKPFTTPLPTTAPVQQPSPQTPSQPTVPDQSAYLRNAIAQVVRQSADGLGQGMQVAEQLGVITAEQKRRVAAEVAGERAKYDEQLAKEGATQQRLQTELADIDQKLTEGKKPERRSSMFPSSWGPGLSSKERGQLAQRAKELEAKLTESRQKGQEIINKAREARDRILREALAKILKK